MLVIVILIFTCIMLIKLPVMEWKYKQIYLELRTN